MLGLEPDTPLIEPPVIVTLLAFWLAIVPKLPATFCTKAVVAIWVVFVPADAVGAVGVPERTEFTELTAPLKLAVEPDKAPVNDVVPATDRLPETEKLPAAPVFSGRKLVPSQ
jgi:hypothetical protein